MATVEETTQVIVLIVPVAGLNNDRTVVIGLRYLAKGDLLSEVADLHGVSRSSACHLIDRFVEAVNDRLDNLRFPRGRHLIDVKEGFNQKSKIPNTFGAIDGTLLPIVTTSENEEVFVCRKGFHALMFKAYLEENDIGHLLGDQDML